VSPKAPSFNNRVPYCTSPSKPEKTLLTIRSRSDAEQNPTNRSTEPSDPTPRLHTAHFYRAPRKPRTYPSVIGPALPSCERRVRGSSPHVPRACSGAEERLETLASSRHPPPLRNPRPEGSKGKPSATLLASAPSSRPPPPRIRPGSSGATHRQSDPQGHLAAAAAA
jgi:hypothetical protein